MVAAAEDGMPVIRETRDRRKAVGSQERRPRTKREARRGKWGSAKKSWGG